MHKTKKKQTLLGEYYMRSLFLILSIDSEAIASVDFIADGSTPVCTIELPHVLVTLLQMLS